MNIYIFAWLEELQNMKKRLLLFLIFFGLPKLH